MCRVKGFEGWGCECRCNGWCGFGECVLGVCVGVIMRWWGFFVVIRVEV